MKILNLLVVCFIMGDTPVLTLPESRFCRVSKAILHSAKALPSVTLGKGHSANILSANGSLLSTFFGHLPSVEKHSAKKNTRQIKNRKNKKIAKHFLNYRNNSPTLPYYLIHYPIIFHYYFESNLYVL
jgi:hypothetical protein